MPGEARSYLLLLKDVLLSPCDPSTDMSKTIEISDCFGIIIHL
jgi:hypothetical protein